MQPNEKKNIIFRLIFGLLTLSITALTVFFFIKTLDINKENEYTINLIGLGGIAFFALIEALLMFKNITKQIIFHSIIFNEHNNTINWPAFIVANIGFGIGVILETVSLVLLLASKNITIISSSMVLIPLAAFIILNCIIYDLYLLLHRERKMKITDLLK